MVDTEQNPIYLQGVAFNNFIWFDNIEPHHSEIDYQRVSDMGMNTIRFYMNYRYFEDDSNMSFSEGRFEIKHGYSYQISGWMKGENITGEDGGKIRLDFYKVDGPLLKRNKAFLENYLGSIAEWAEARNAALYMGEFGAGTPCFENDKGGLIWVANMVDILKTNNIHFTYHAYHEDAFGLYLGGGLPDPNNVNQPLIDWFTANLN